MEDVIYLKLNRDIKTKEERINIGKLASITGSNHVILAKVKSLTVCYLRPDTQKREIISVAKVIEVMLKEYPKLQVQSIGEMECIVEYVGDKKKSKVIDILKIAFVSAISFFGAGFAIMTFNEDVSVGEVFEKIHYLVYQVPKEGFGILEFTYSIGMASGIILFYNHIGTRRITKDPTPIEVQMRVYENDVNNALVETAQRKGELHDVD